MRNTPLLITEILAGWAREPAWLAMHPRERGIHASLVLLAAARGEAMVPDTPDTWRACDCTESVFEPGGALDRIWQRIDDKMALRRPDLTGRIGWRLSALVERALGLAAPCGGLVVTKGDTKAETVEDALPRLLLETPRYERLTPAIVMGCFKASGQDERASLWEMGLAWLAQEEGSRRGSRAYLGRLIKEFGEREVFLAVADAVSRKVSPAEAKSWLRGALRRRCEGSPAEQAAREARTRVLM